MNKESIVYIVIALVAGALLGVVIFNAKKNVSSNNPAPIQAEAPAPGPGANFQQQISMLKGIVAKDPDNRNAWVQLGNNYFDSNQPMNAVEAYDKALQLDGNDPNVLTDQGVMYRRLGWYDKAVKNFEKASKVDPNHRQSLYNLGIVYRDDLHDIPNAIAAWERFLAINPNGPGSDQVRAELKSLKSSPTMPTPEAPTMPTPEAPTMPTPEAK